MAIMSTQVKRPIPTKLLRAIRESDDSQLVHRILSDDPAAISAIEEVIAHASALGAISFEISTVTDDGGPPLTLRLRIPKGDGQFKQRRADLREWWYSTFSVESDVVLLSVLPGKE